MFDDVYQAKDEDHFLQMVGNPEKFFQEEMDEMFLEFGDENQDELPLFGDE
jgi:hypothetical protein